MIGLAGFISAKEIAPILERMTNSEIGVEGFMGSRVMVVVLLCIVEELVILTVVVLNDRLSCSVVYVYVEDGSLSSR